MIYCGIDASTTCTGWCIFDNNKLIDYGKIFPDDPKAEWRDRLRSMSINIAKIIDEHNPNMVYCEDIPLANRGMKTLVMLGALQGLLIGIFNSKHIRVEFIPVATWRSTIGLFTGKKEGMTRDAMKQSSVEYANNKFGLDLKWISPNSKKNDDDISDSINICWSQIMPKEEKQSIRKGFKKNK